MGLLSFCNHAPVLCNHHIVCIHDLHTRLLPSSHGQLFRWAHPVILPLLGRRAARVATVSELARDHLIKFGVVPERKIGSPKTGGDHALRPENFRGNRFLPVVRLALRGSIASTVH
jgi:hypothetical protein